MKKIRYQIVSGNFESDTKPSQIENYLIDKEVLCSDDMIETAIAFYKDEMYNGVYSVEDVVDDRPLDEIRADKLIELSIACNSAITKGIDVETTQGIEHFSLQETDQINLTTALTAIQNGSSAYPYHADGQLCRLFSAKEIQDIAEASIKHKLYHTTLCNHLLIWARRTEDKKELADIKYSIEGLPEDLMKNMADVLEKAV